MITAPALFISHGAPRFALEPGVLGPQLSSIGERLDNVKALLVVSPHWQTQHTAIMTTPYPPTLHDYAGFPPELYRSSIRPLAIRRLQPRSDRASPRRVGTFSSITDVVSITVRGSRCDISIRRRRFRPSRCRCEAIWTLQERCGSAERADRGALRGSSHRLRQPDSQPARVPGRRGA